MSFKDDIFKQNTICEFMALYGWQDNLGGENLIQYGYIAGYKNAGDYLVEIAVKNAEQDSLLFPIMFNYRQFLELLLKWICRQRQTDVEYKNIIETYKHSLSKILHKVLSFNDVTSHLNDENLLYLEEVVGFFDDYDKQSFNFRFPLDKKLNNSIPLKGKNELRINLEILKYSIDYIDDLFYGFYAM